MTDIHDYIKQVEQNQKLTAEKMGIEHKLESDPNKESAKAAFFTGKADREAEKSDDLRAAESLERIAKNSVMIAQEGAGVPEYKVHGEATSATEKARDLFVPGNQQAEVEKNLEARKSFDPEEWD